MTAVAISKPIPAVFYVESYSVKSIVHPSINVIDTAAQIATINGGGTAAHPNKIGANSLPVGTEAETHGGWASDASYPSDGVAATVSTIGGGKNHVNNMIAGTICGGDSNFIPYLNTGHATIAGGKLNINQGGYGFIGGGLRNAIAFGANVSAIIGGENNLIESTFSVIGGGKGNAIHDLLGSLSVIGGGEDNTIDTESTYGFIGGGDTNTLDDTDYSAILGGKTNAITTSNYSSIGGGENNTITSGTHCFIGGGLGNSCTSADYAFIGGGDGNAAAGDYSAILSGLDCTASGLHSIVHGNDCDATHDYSWVFGQEQQSWCDSSMNFGGEKLVEIGDNGISIQQGGARTTDATATQICSVTLPAKFVAANVRLRVVGTKDGSADGNNDADYGFAIYEREIGFHWTGTDAYLYDAAGSSGPSTTPSLALNKRAGNSSVDYTPTAVACKVAGGVFSVEVQGTAEIVNWNVDIEWTLLKVS